MLVDRATAWLLVSISPFEVMICPVPAAWPDPTTVLMSTMAGSTLAAMASVLSLPPVFGAGWIGEPGCAGCSVMGWVLVCAVPLCALIVRARLQPIPAPAAAAITAAMTTPAATWCQTELFTGGAGGGGGAQAGTGDPAPEGGSSEWSGGGPSGRSLGWFCISDIGVYLRKRLGVVFVFQDAAGSLEAVGRILRVCWEPGLPVAGFPLSLARHAAGRIGERWSAAG